MSSNTDLEAEGQRLDGEISELRLEIAKAEGAPDEGKKLSWTRDDEIAKYYAELEQKVTRLKEINRLIGRQNPEV